MAIESVGGSIISKIAELLVEPTIRQFRYMFCFNDFVQEFNERKQNLTLARDRLQNAVDVAERNAEEIEKDVNKWLEDANNEIEDVKHFEVEIGKNGECFTWCPNWRRRYKLSKALGEKKETFSKLEEKSKIFLTVSHKAPLQDIEFLPSKDFTPSESSKEAFKQIMEALKDDNVNTIGLYGMGGVGKTTLVKEVCRRAKELQLFDRVLMAVVSQNPNVTNIQYKMADSLGLKFEERSIEGRADRLWQRLQKEKTMLIILDDVWKDIDLREIGIPFGDSHRGCKILLTTRLKNICSSMDCQQKVFLNVLSEKEAWALFEGNAGLSALNEVAKKVARECNGLPIALVTVGRALRDQSAIQWEVAYERLKKSQFLRMEQIDEQKNAYACLKLSYDYLKHEETKLCFLLCCLFPEDHNIPIEDLTRYAVGYGLHRDAESIEDARKQVHVAVENLKACCMLLGTESEQHVKMHDLVRDVAIQIASSKEFDFVVKAGIGLKEWPMSIKSFEGCTVISLMGNRLTELHDGLVCPLLKVLLLELDGDLNVPFKFFEGMKAIEVLSIEGGSLSLESLECSTHLQSLEFINCECKDLISLRKLQKLKILGFLGCSSIKELPAEIGELKNLRLLELRGCWRLTRIPVNLIGRLKKLEELLIGDTSFKNWDSGGTSIGGMNASLTELNSLPHLAVLSVGIPWIRYIPRDFVFPKLLKYEILIGIDKQFLRSSSVISRGSRYPNARRLAFTNTSAGFLNAKTFEQLFPSVSRFDLNGVGGLIWSPDQMTTHEQQQGFLQGLEFVKVTLCDDICTLFPAKLWRALKTLKSVVIEICRKLEEVFELGEVDQVSDEEKVLLLSSLTTLQLSRLPKLNCIWKGPTRHVSLRSLTYLKLETLSELKFIFTPSLAQSLPKLETLEIRGCSELDHIIIEKDDDSEGEIIPDSICFPELKTLFIKECDELEYVFPVSVAPSLVNLEQIKIESAKKLKHIFGSGEGEDKLTTDGDRDGIIKLPQLRKLELLRSGSNLNFFGPDNFAAEVPSLQHLRIQGHNQLSNLLAKLQGLTNLETLAISECYELSSLYNGPILKNLTALEFTKCDSLRHIFSPSIISSLAQLKSLKISFCNELEEIIATHNDGAIFLGSEHLKSLCFPNLLDLSLEGLSSLVCFSTAAYEFTFPNLETLTVRDCPKMTTMLTVDANDSTSAKPEGLTNLRNLRIEDCEGLKEVMQVGSFVTNRRGGREISLLSLDTLKLSSLPDLRSIWKGLMLKNLTTLEVTNCKGLKHIFPSSMIASLLQLKVLLISRCEELEKIIAKDEDDKDQMLSESHLQSLCFPSLCEIEVSECNKLKSLFPVTAAAGLPQLQSLKVSEAPQLTEVFGQDDKASSADIKIKEIKVPALLKLSLKGLPSLVCFSTTTCDFIFPNLKELTVTKCHKMATMFTVDVNVSTNANPEGLIDLKYLSIEDCEGVEEVMQVGSFITNRRGGCELSLLSLESLTLSSLPDLRCIWKGLMLKKLRALKVINCKGLRHILPSRMIASLRQLEILSISRCEELEEIIAKDDDDKDKILSESHHQSLCFPSLWKIEVSACKKLKSLFPVITAAGLPRLEYLKVGEAPQLTEISGQDDKASHVNVEKEIVVPNLLELKLKNLPSIVCFSFGCKNFLFPRLERCMVGNCPNMATKFIIIQNGSVSAQSEVSQVAEDSSNTCAMPSSTYKIWTRDDGWVEEEDEYDLLWWRWH